MFYNYAIIKYNVEIAINASLRVLIERGESSPISGSIFASGKFFTVFFQTFFDGLKTADRSASFSKSR